MIIIILEIMEGRKLSCLFQIESYNSFFHPNVCHICKHTEDLTECPSCRMISYCGEDHMMLHRKKHKKICQAIVELTTEKNIFNSRYMLLENWLNFKKENMESIRRILERDLRQCEKQMFLRAKSCIVCRVQRNLSACEICMSIYVCPNHELIKDHPCFELRLSLSLDWYSINESIYYSANNRKISAEYLNFDRKVVHDMKTFIRYSSLTIGPQYTWSPEDYILTDVFTQPLTLYYGMLQAQLFDCVIKDSQNVVIHLLLGQYIISNTLAGWEIILHEMSENSNLIIISIGPELWERTYDYDLCPACRSKFKKLLSDYWCMSYSDYIKSSYYVKPNIVVGYNMELLDQEALKTILLTIQSHNCPLLLTAKSKSKADSNVTLIKGLLGPLINPVVHDKNKFGSLRPHRDDESDFVFYCNQYLTIYLDLNN